MRRFLVLLLLLAPAPILFFFKLQPDLDPIWQIPLFHFYIVTFVAFTAAVISFLLSVSLGPVARPRHVLVAVAFAAMSTLFLTHGLSTPGALLPSDHPFTVAVGWSAWLTLFSGAILFSLAGFNPPEGPTRRQANNILVLSLLAVLAYMTVVVGAPHWLRLIESEVAPWHRLAIFYATLLLWLVAAYKLWQSWRLTHSRVDGALVFVALWMAQAAVSMHLFPLWHLSWWLYHFILLAGFLFTAYVLFSQYEQARQFRLTRYYLSAALIMTVFLALLASFLFSRFAQVVIESEAMTMADVTLQARAAGLLIAASTMGLLFISLLGVVRRAEGIITSRTEELALAYRNLRHAETMRDDMTNMIIHDLRTPLTAIATSLALLRHLAPGAEPEMQTRIMERSERAIVRLDQMIDDILKEHIFRKFGQAPQDDERPLRKGSGLGLAFCRLVAELHGGTIWVEDAPGGGSDFKLRLPTLPSQAESQGIVYAAT